MRIPLVLMALISTAGLAAVPSQAAAVAQTAKKTSTKKNVAPKPAQVKASPAFAPMIGIWYTKDSNGNFAKANKFTFSSPAIFKYAGPGWSSEGTFTFKDRTLVLTWQKVDGVKVAKPFTRTVQLTDSKKQFQIERFVFGRA